MKVVIDPRSHERLVGTSAQVNWKDPELKRCIEKMIFLKESEEITQLEVDETGITVRLKIKG